jgi:hypothetical protein
LSSSVTFTAPPLRLQVRQSHGSHLGGHAVRATQSDELVLGKRSPLTGAQAPSRDSSIARANERQHRLPSSVTEAANLSVSPLRQRDLQPRLGSLYTHPAHSSGLRAPSVDLDTLAPPTKRFVSDDTPHLGHVDFRDRPPRVLKGRREVTIIGEQEYTARAVIQSAHG